MSNMRLESLENQTSYKWYFLQICMIVFTFLSIFLGKHELLPLTNLSVPDSGYYEHWVFQPRDKGLANGFLYVNTFLYSIGEQSFLFYNSALLLMSIYFCSVFECISSKAVSLARAVIVFNPYLLLSVMGPTKEINLTFLSVFSLYLFLKNSPSMKILGILPAICAMLIRPQFGLILIISLLSMIMLRYISRTMWVCLLIFVAFLLINSIPQINTIISNSGGEELEYFSTSNYYEVAMILKMMQENPILQIPALLIKLALVMFAPIARPNSLFATYIPLLDWGYTFMGWFLFPLNFAFLLLFFFQKVAAYPRVSHGVQLLILYGFLGVFSTIISPVIQARYLYPYAPVLAACYFLHDIKIRNRILIISTFMILASFYMTAVFLPKKWDVKVDDSHLFVSWF